MNSLTPMLLEGGGGVDPLAYDPSAFILTLLIFVVLFGLLVKFAWNPILDALDAREKRIEDNVNAAEKARADAENLVVEYREKLRDAERQVAQRVEEGRASAERQAQEIVEKAQEAAERERESLRAAAASHVAPTIVPGIGTFSVRDCRRHRHR